MGKLIPFLPGDASEDELMLVAEGTTRLPEIHIDVDELGRIKIGMKDREDDGRTGDGLLGFQ